jgi:hypothetical protein
MKPRSTFLVAHDRAHGGELILPLGARKDLAQFGHIHRNRIGRGLHTPPLVDDLSPGADHADVGENVGAGLQETAGVALGLEAEAVGLQHRIQQILPHAERENAPGVGAWPGDVQEGLDRRSVADQLAQEAREEVEVVILRHHDNRAIELGDDLGSGDGELAVDPGVSLLPRAPDRAIDDWRAGKIVQLVLHEPEEGVADHIVVSMIVRGVGRDEANPHLLDRLNTLADRREPVAVPLAERAGDPGDRVLPRDAADCRDEATRAAPRDGLALPHAESKRTAIGDDHKVGLGGLIHGRQLLCKQTPGVRWRTSVCAESRRKLCASGHATAAIRTGPGRELCRRRAPNVGARRPAICVLSQQSSSATGSGSRRAAPRW